MLSSQRGFGTGDSWTDDVSFAGRRWGSIYLSSILNLLAPLLSFRLYWLLLLVPALGGYKLYQFAKPFLAQRTQTARQQADAMLANPGGGGAGAATAESSSKRQEKMKKKQEKMERAQTGGKGARR